MQSGLKRIASVLSVLAFMLTTFLFMSNLLAEDKFLISAQPSWDMPNKRPYPFVIYKYEPSGNTLDSVWSLEKDEKVWSLNLYSDQNLLSVMLGDWFPQKMIVLSTDNLETKSIIDFGSLPHTSLYFLIESENNNHVFKVFYRKNLEDKRLGYFDESVLDLDGNMVSDRDKSYTVNDIRITGPLPPYGSGYGNVISFKIDDNGKLFSNWVGNFTGTPIPDNLIHFDTVESWVMIVNTNEYSTFISIPFDKGLKERELLIYNKNNESWTSFLIKGTTTLPRLIDDWLVGVVAYAHPKTDYKIRKGYPPILSNEVVMINPLEQVYFTAELGDECEVLLIVEDTVYYRTGVGFRKGKIKDKTIVDRELLMTDTLFSYIHWGFGGGRD